MSVNVKFVVRGENDKPTRLQEFWLEANDGDGVRMCTRADNGGERCLLVVSPGRPIGLYSGCNDCSLPVDNCSRVRIEAHSVPDHAVRDALRTGRLHELERLLDWKDNQ